MRKRFTPAEREAFGTVGSKVEWRNGAHWHPGIVRGPIVNDGAGRSGFERIWVENRATTRTVHPGIRIDASPTFIREVAS